MNAARLKAMRGIPRCQNGAALIVSLLFLLILTLVGVTSAMVSSLEERMSGNLRDRNLAFQAAESALRAGELAVVAALATHINCTDTFVCTLAANLAADSSVWSGDSAVTYTGYSDAMTKLASPPKYLIEVLDPIPRMPPGLGCALRSGEATNSDPNCILVCTYRVTARGVGSTAAAVVILQSTYRYPATIDTSVSGGGKCHA